VDRTGDSGELNAATREQRLTEADSGRSRVGRLKELRRTWQVIAVVVPVVKHVDRAAGRELFANRRLKLRGFLRQHRRSSLGSELRSESTEEGIVLICGVPSPDERRRELRVELRQGSLHAATPEQ